MSTVNGESAIGSATGIAMAASEDADPFPSVEVPEGADILPKERKKRLITCLTGETANTRQQVYTLVLLQPCAQRKVRVIYS